MNHLLIRASGLEFLIVYELGSPGRLSGPPEACFEGYDAEIQVESSSIKISGSHHFLTWELWDALSKKIKDEIEVAVREDEIESRRPAFAERGEWE